MDFFKFHLHIGKSDWYSKSYYNDSSDFPYLRNEVYTLCGWLQNLSGSSNSNDRLSVAQFLVVTKLVQNIMDLAFNDSRSTVSFATDFVTIINEH